SAMGMWIRGSSSGCCWVDNGRRRAGASVQAVWQTNESEAATAIPGKWSPPYIPTHRPSFYLARGGILMAREKESSNQRLDPSILRPDDTEYSLIMCPHI